MTDVAYSQKDLDELKERKEFFESLRDKYNSAGAVMDSIRASDVYRAACVAFVENNASPKSKP